MLCLLQAFLQPGLKPYLPYKSCLQYDAALNTSANKWLWHGTRTTPPKKVRTWRLVYPISSMSPTPSHAAHSVCRWLPCAAHAHPLRTRFQGAPCSALGHQTVGWVCPWECVCGYTISMSQTAKEACKRMRATANCTARGFKQLCKVAGVGRGREAAVSYRGFSLQR